MMQQTQSKLKYLLASALISVFAFSATAQTKLPVKQLSAGIYVIHAEVAATDAERQQGLMMRTKMANSEGMIFDFGAPATVCMWMKNTLIPLSVAFIDADGRIVNIEDMQPETTDSHCAKRVVLYALEMNQGWFKQKNIKPGSKIEGLPLK
ncbi:MAG: DUF192 domain-containing protein [Burkholderiales bacterium]|nr:DUF192 domain-containing protein [Burkholderiales bacterium]